MTDIVCILDKNYIGYRGSFLANFTIIIQNKLYKTVDFDGEKVETKVTETTTKTTTENGNVTDTTTEGPVTVREHATTDDTTTTVETDENGTTTTVENVKTEKGTREDGTIVDYNETTTVKTEYNGDKKVSEQGENKGTEILVISPDVSVTVIGENNASVKGGNGYDMEFTASAGVVDKTDGEVPTDPANENYEYTHTYTNTDKDGNPDVKEVTLWMNKEKIHVGNSVLSDLKPIETVWDANNPKADTSGPRPDWYLDWGETAEDYLGSKPSEEFDFLLTGLGEDGYYGTSYKTYDKDGNLISQTYDKDGKLISEYEDGDITQFKLQDMSDPESAEVKMHTAYCVDLSTGVGYPTWYKIENLEDAEYYDTTPDPETGISEADHIRAIVNNGYWGTAETEYEDDGVTVKTAAEKGSLDYMKQNLLKNLDKTGMTAEQVNALTPGEAQAATQIAIWNYGDSAEGAKEFFASDANGGSYTFETDKEPSNNPDADAAEAAAWARIDALAAYLTGLHEQKTETDVITAEKFVDELSFTVNEQVEGHENNLDEDETNDAYNVSLSFGLVVEPDKEKDDLVVKVVKVVGQNDDGSLITEVVKTARIAGQANEGETVVNAENGVYTLTGLELIENKDIQFDLKLEGTQYLEEGVYLYSAETYTSAQTLVGLAQGEKAVDVGMTIDLEFNVEEGSITQKRAWRKTWHDESKDEPSGGGNDPTPEKPTPEEPIPEEPTPENPTPEDPGKVLGDEEELLDIGDEGTPKDDMLLADAEDERIAATGDSNHMTGAFGGMFAALAGMFMLRRKKEN